MIDKNRVSQNFNRAADTYEKFAQVQRVMTTHLVESLASSGKKYPTILEIGSGTGWLTDQLLSLMPDTSIDLLDISPAMAARCKEKYKKEPRIRSIVGDGEALPDLGRSYDLIISSACFQWFHNPEKAIASYKKILNQQGTLLFSTFGKNTFHELRTSFYHAYQHLGSSYKPYHGQYFPSLNDWKKFLAGYDVVSLEESEKKYFFPSVHDFTRSVKKVGAGSASPIKPQASLAVVRLMRDKYQKKYSSPKGVQATYHIIYGKAVKN